MTHDAHEPAATFDGERWSNADEDRIALIGPDPRWAALFAEEAAAILAALGARQGPGGGTERGPRLDPGAGPGVRLEHFGSTAVPGLVAKPIIDILLIPGPDVVWSGLIDPLRSLDYVYWAENPRTDRMFFVKGMPPHGRGRTHHVHVRTAEDAAPALLFRDFLRARPGASARYADVKRALAARHPTDREAYTAGKSACVLALIEEARAWAAALR